ncbi:hypothetical protein JKF63_07013 [Porcisia hertigi]|uniref:CCHC-type domain-containing protein n=1 Tax=Porcisia hertigi TaxID=2761500 RepID=A0A836I2E7_9TRYP|nr:hypothetical protein JKF63_07013 [Porcisia hertigi]
MTDLIGLPPSKAVSTPSGFAQCYVHNVRRKAECCEMKPVFNADMEVVDYICVCKQAFTCKSSNDQQSSHLVGEAVAGGARTDSPGGGSSGAAPLMIDASSTSMTAHSSSHHHRHGQPSAAGAVNRDASVSTVFAVSFYSSSCTAPGPSESAAAAGAVSENLSLKNGQTKGDEHDEAPKTDVMTIGDSGSDDVDSLDNLPLPTTGAAPATATAAPAAAAAGSPLLPPRGRQRYYDSIQNTGTSGSAPPVKVCWSCGMSGHEKPACPNSLCRTCHQKRGPYGSPHRCTLVVTPSPFIVYPTPSEWHAITLKTAAAAGEPSGMEAVRCVACNEYGHFDCSTIAPPSSYALVASASTGPAAVPHTTLWTCCFCGVRGHTIFDCRQREQVNPDNFERRNQLIADAIRRRGSNTATGVPPNSSGSNSGFVHSSQQQHPQRSYGSPPSGAQSSASSFTRYGNDRAGVGSGGGQRRERDWRDERDQRLGGNPSGNSRREGGNWDNQRRRYESPSFSPAGGGGSALPSSPLLHGRDRFQGNSYRHHAERSHDNYGGRRQTQSGSDRGGGASRGYDQRLHNSQPSPPHHDRLSHRGGRRRGGGGSGYDSGDDLF